MPFGYDFKNKKALISVSAFLLLAGIFYLAQVKYLNQPEQIYCTMEAKLCPDGSYVGRTGPKCEFTACPGLSENDFTETLTDAKTGISLRYPKELPTKYIHVFDWPPQIQVTDEKYSCSEGGNEIMRAGETREQIIDGRNFCVTKLVEGAAGSMYTQYAYAFSYSNKTAILTFTLRSVQCGNYNDPQKNACETERAGFDIDSIVDQIMRTIKYE